MVENTAFNFEMIASHRLTRAIEFKNEFEFQFNREMKMPKFLEFALCVAESLDNDTEIDEIDEMVGTF